MRSLTSCACWLLVAYRCLTIAWHSCSVGGLGECGGTWTSRGSTVALNGRPVDVGSSLLSRSSKLFALFRPPVADVDFALSCFGFLTPRTHIHMHTDRETDRLREREKKFTPDLVCSSMTVADVSLHFFTSSFPGYYFHFKWRMKHFSYLG